MGVADLDYEFSLDLFEKSNLKLIFGYVQNHHSYLDSATPVYAKGRTVVDGFKENLPIVFDEYLPKWNYKVIPQNNQNA